MLRNKEFKKFTVVFIIISAGLITTGFILNTAAGLIAALCVFTLGLLFYNFTKARYKSIAQITTQINFILHGAERLELDSFNEGELSILHSEITKMTLRIREQNELLKKDKQYLADTLADIAHQLRTPLTSVNLILTFLTKNPAHDEQKSLVRELEGLLIKMDWLITSLLKLSRVDAGVVKFKAETVDVRQLIQSVLTSLAISLELRSIEVTTDISESAFIQGDEKWLYEALLNILKNCMDYLENAENKKIEIKCTENALFTEIIIRDNGKGFSKEDLPYLFDRFYRGTGSDASGYGIGLALCKKIITQQGGSVTAKNHPQGGAVFSVRFNHATF